jgi:endoglucanase
VLDSWVFVRSYGLTHDQKYLEGVLLAAQTGAGANPDNRSYTSGVGLNPVLRPLHVDTRMADLPVPEGITVLGPADNSSLLLRLNPTHKLFSTKYWPDANDWPVIESYHDAFLDPLLTEFSIHQTLAPNVLAWGSLSAVQWE